jgi:hypothetical protein
MNHHHAASKMLNVTNFCLLIIGASTPLSPQGRNNAAQDKELCDLWNSPEGANRRVNVALSGLMRLCLVSFPTLWIDHEFLNH